MATPAASAFHRRRHVLSAPAVQTTSFARKNPTQHHQTTSRSTEPRLTPTVAPSPTPITRAAQSARPNLLTQLPNIHFHSIASSANTQSSLVLSLLVSALSILIANVFFNQIPFIGYQLSVCSSLFHHYPVRLTLLRIILFLMYVPVLSTIDSIAAETKATLLSWRNHTRFAKHFVLRPHVRYAVASACAALFQTIAVAYIMYGPSLILASWSPSKCASMDCRSRLFTTGDELSLHVISSLIAAMVHTLLWIWFGAYISISYPFHASVGKRLLLHCPRIVALAGSSAFISALWVTLFHPMRMEEGSLNMSAWNAIREKLAYFVAAFGSTFVVLFSWNCMAAIRELLRGGDGVGWLTLKDKKATDAVIGRERFAILARQAIAGRGEEGREQVVRQMVGTLHRITRTEKDLAQFPGFSDANGKVWEVALAQCLAPLELLQEILRESNVRFYQAKEASSRLRVGRFNFGKLRYSRGYSEKFVCAIADVCIAVCGVMGAVYAASYNLDTYGVVHRTLVRAVRTLLICKEQTEHYLTLRKGRNLRTTTVMARLKEWRVVRSEYDCVWAVDDAIMLAMYRIVDTFYGHFKDIAEGVEVTWDRSLDRQLQMFLEYQTS